MSASTQDQLPYSSKTVQHSFLTLINWCEYSSSPFSVKQLGHIFVFRLLTVLVRKHAARIR